MEPAAAKNCITVHVWFLQKDSVHGQPFNALNARALFLSFFTVSLFLTFDI